MKVSEYIQSAIKRFVSTPLNTAVNIAGLSLGISIFVLMMLYINYQKSYNDFHENLDNIYRLEAALGGITPAPYHSVFTKSIPQVKMGSRLIQEQKLINYYGNEEKKLTPGINARVLSVDTNFFRIFTYPVVKGSINELLKSPDNIALTEKAAENLFGEKDPINKMIHFEGEPHTVKAIMADVPKNSSIHFDGIKGISTDQIDEEDWRRWHLETYFLISDQVNISKLEKKMDRMNFEFYRERGGDNDELPYTIHLRPYKDIYFSDVLDHHRKGNKSNVLIFTLVAVFILLIACINYINLSIATASTRLKELGLRKINGAHRKDIIFQVLTESIMLSYISVLVAVVIIEFTLPLLRNLTDKAIYLDYHFTFLFLLLFVIPLILGFLGGIYPGIYISKFNLSDVIRGKWVTGKSGVAFRKILTIVQFAISVFLIISTMFVYNQINFIQNYDLGYTTRQIVSFRTNAVIRQHLDAFKNRLLKISGVQYVTNSNVPINDANHLMSVFPERSSYKGEHNLTVIQLKIDEDFFRLFGIEIFEKKADYDQLFDKKKDVRYLINKKLADILPGDTAVGKLINGKEIIGVTENIRTGPLYKAKRPTVFQVAEDQEAVYIYLKMDSEDYSALLSEIESAWKEFSPEHPFTYKILDDTIMEMYEEELRFGRTFLIFSILSILIACLGLFALVSFNTERRTKEIGIRKTMGATSTKINVLLIKQFTIWVILSNLIAWPVAYFFLKNWLRNFSEHIEIQLIYFIIAGLLSFLIAFLTISYKSLRAANANPVKSLRYE